MATTQMNEVLQHLRRVMAGQNGAGLTDGQLLEDYLSRRDEAALAALVRRHGPLVWGVCRRVLANYHDAEDAFQATFLVLVRKAASILPREMVANWLYGVAHQTALKARATAARRKGRERQVARMPEPAVTEQDLWRDLQPVLDEELSRLPGKYRAVIVLCDLEGKTRKQAARQLGVPEGTVAGQLARARAMLAKRLTQRCVALSGAMLAAAVSQKVASAGVPSSVASSTIKAASLFASGQAATGAISVKVAALTEGVLKAMLLNKLRAVLVLFVVAALCAAGGLIYRTRAAEQPNQPAVAKNDEKPTSDKERLQGTWIPTEMEINGVEFPFAFVQPPEGFHATFSGNKLTTNFTEEKEYTFGLYPSEKPRAIDLRPATSPAKTLLGIYQLDGDNLKLCYCITGKQERPPAFENYWRTGSRTILLVLKRQQTVQKKEEIKKEDGKAKATAPNKEVAKSDKDQLLGKWLLISSECNGQDRMQPWLKNNALLVIEEADGKLVCKTVFKDKAKVFEVFAEDMEKWAEATLKLDARTKPKTLDATGVHENGTYLGIYKLDGDTLTWCLSKALTPKGAETDKDRPTDFSTTSGDGRSLSVYKRQREAEPKRRDSLPVPAKKADAAKTDLDRLRGIWTAIWVEAGGERHGLKAVFMVDGKRACLQSGDTELQGGLYLGPAAKPKTFDLATSTRTIEGIYSLEGDTLRLSCDPRGVEESKRPGGFLTEKGSPQVLLVLKRTSGPEVFPFRLPDGTRAFPTIIEGADPKSPHPAPQPKESKPNYGSYDPGSPPPATEKK